ncbi:MAG: M28 family peptidase [Bacteroidales bacterium]
MKRTLPFLFFIILIFNNHGYSQDLEYAKRLVHILASDSMEGRGYQGDADLKAATLIRDEFERLGLKPFRKDYFQPVFISINSIVGPTHCEVDGKVLEPGVDYFISARSVGTKSTYSLVWLDHSTAVSKKKLKRFLRQDLSRSLVVISPEVAADKDLAALRTNLYRGGGTKDVYHSNLAGIVQLSAKPGWHISDAAIQTQYLVLQVRDSCLQPGSRHLTLIFRNSFESEYVSHNVIGYVPGTREPDKFVVFTAHYDHLGKMGEVILPGANDNASGTAMILDLARHYAANPAPWSVAFMAFTAEERGLVGSIQYTNKPLFPLKQIDVLFNLDMVGSGSDGITVVNGSVYKRDFDILDSINRAEGFLKQVKIRGESSNSDHAPFHWKGVKSFFIYTMGDEFREYHNVYDRPEGLPFTAYNELFRLLTKYSATIME